MTTRPLPSPGDGLSALGPFATLRLIALDIDGTLPSASSGQIGSVVGDLQASLASYRRGVALTVATGRTYRAAQATLQRLRLSSRTNVVLYNGAVGTTASGEGLWLRSRFSDEDVAAVLRCARQMRLPAYVFRCWADLSTVSGLEQSIRESIVGVSPQPESMLEFGGLPIDWVSSAAFVEDATAILLPTPTVAVHHQATKALAEARPMLSIAASSPAYVEVSPPGCSKATALSALANRIDITREEVAAVGDNGNDVAMLSWAGVGVAVASATEAALQASDYVTRRPAGDGVVEFLRLVRSAVRFRSMVR